MAGTQISGNGLHSLRCLPALESLNLRSCQGLGVAGEDPLSALGYLTGTRSYCRRRDSLRVKTTGCCELAYFCFPLTLAFVATTIFCVCYLGGSAAVSRLPLVMLTSNTFKQLTCFSPTTPLDAPLPPLLMHSWKPSHIQLHSILCGRATWVCKWRGIDRRSYIGCMSAVSVCCLKRSYVLESCSTLPV